MRHTQRGIGMLSLFVLIAVVSLLGTVTIRLAPVYLDYWGLTRVIEGVVKEHNGTDASPVQVRSTLSRHFVTNRVEAVSIRDLKISVVDDNVVIDASYEKRVPLIFNVDAVVKFEDARYVIERK
ncbi:DUF4845 domain-containing protein [Spongiibacter nanhainus]|uniref:DUF4845 domain-containing protein n=1 Tax=Spongiibacter nanhainus TaxID=2794344 RepID=A0A7T4R2F9_9GAMM|nr:DUF4845 domain-containing protein [Spongiibacter nanhainus]QQD19216.1 DUF4845 domain-containing protein [Spongiibacter nanhainus]